MCSGEWRNWRYRGSDRCGGRLWWTGQHVIGKKGQQGDMQQPGASTCSAVKHTIQPHNPSTLSNDRRSEIENDLFFSLSWTSLKDPYCQCCPGGHDNSHGSWYSQGSF